MLRRCIGREVVDRAMGHAASRLELRAVVGLCVLVRGLSAATRCAETLANIAECEATSEGNP